MVSPYSQIPPYVDLDSIVLFSHWHAAACPFPQRGRVMWGGAYVPPVVPKETSSNTCTLFVT